MAFTLAQIRAKAAEAAKTGPDYNEQKNGGGDYTPPAEGSVRLRLVGYIEAGLHTTESSFGKKTKNRGVLIFELSGKKHPPKKLDDGRLVPYLIEVKEPIGQNKKSNFSKLFKNMVKDYPDRKNFGELVGEAFMGKIVHRKFKRRDGSDGVVAELKGESGYTVGSLFYEDDEGEPRKYKVDEPISPLRLFLWDNADLEQWDSLFIDGTYDNGDSKNKYQEYIKQAENLEGSAIYEALIEAGREEELVPAEKHPREGEPAPEGEAEKPEPTPRKVTPAQVDDDEDEDDEEEEDEPVKEAPKKAPPKAVAPPKKEVKATPAPAKKTAQKPAKRAEPEDDDSDPLAGL